MDATLSLTTIQILAWSKIILFSGVAVFFVLLWRQARPGAYVALLTAAVTLFYAIMSRPLQTMFWGTSGDEVFMSAFLTRVMADGWFSDFYYAWLPPFYPPLYFWLTGTVARPFVETGVGAAKIGVLATLLLWFIVPYLWQKLFWRLADMKESASDVLVRSPWFWLLVPTVFMLLLDFDNIILKPYETFSALMAVCFVGAIARAMQEERWSHPLIIFFGVTGGLLFLTYYFWWFILIPALFFLALSSKMPAKNTMRVVEIGLWTAAVSAIYLVPLLQSFFKQGIENWQAFFFVPSDTATYAPWAEASLRGILFAIGLVGLLAFRANAFLRAHTSVLILAYTYQLVGMVVLVAGGKSAQAAKPFLFLGGAALAVGASAALLYGFGWLQKRFPERQKFVVAGAVLLLLPLSPHVRFIDNPAIQEQIEQDLVVPGDAYLAENIAANVPDYRERVWLTSGTARVNSFIPLTYYLAHNPHFSHQASQYSERLAVVEALTRAPSAEAFTDIINTKTEPPIDGLILFLDPATETYPLFFWEDTYPNGGEERRIDLSPALIDPAVWELRYEDRDWHIYVRGSLETQSAL